MFVPASLPAAREAGFAAIRVLPELAHSSPGTVRHAELLSELADHMPALADGVRDLVDPSAIYRPLHETINGRLASAIEASLARIEQGSTENTWSSRLASDALDRVHEGVAALSGRALRVPF